MKAKQQPTVINFKDFIKDMDSAFDTGITVYFGDMNKRTIVEIDETLNRIQPEDKDYRNTAVFNNITFRSPKRVNYSKIFELYCDCKLINCRFETNVEFRTERNLVLENCSLGNGNDINLHGGNITLKDCDFCQSCVDFRSCSNIIVSDCKFFSCHFQSFCEAYVTVQRCEIQEDVYAEQSHFISFNFLGGKLKTFQFKECHISSLDLSSLDYSGFANKFKPTSLKVDRILINSTFIDHATLISPYIKELNVKSSMLVRAISYDDKLPKISSERSVGFVPTQQHLTLYKKAKVICKDDQKKIDEIIVKLEVPDEAKRVYCDFGKIRVSRAVTVGFYKLNGKKYTLNTKKRHIVIAQYGHDYEYEIGKTQKPEETFDSTYGRCGSGIHGFESFQEAVDYIL